MQPHPNRPLLRRKFALCSHVEDLGQKKKKTLMCVFFLTVEVLLFQDCSAIETTLVSVTRVGRALSVTPTLSLATTTATAL